MTIKNLNIGETLDSEFVTNKGTGKVVDRQIRMKHIDNEDSMNELREQWSNLAKVADVPVYMTYEWISRWWKHFGRHPKREPFVVAIYSGSELIGLAPLFKGVSSIGPITLQRRLNLMGSGVDQNELLGFADDYGYSDFLDIIAHPDYRKEVADHVVDLLVANPMHVDTISLQHVSDKSFVMTNIFPRLKNKMADLVLEKTDKCPYLLLPDSIDAYKDNQLGSSSRRRRFRKNLNPVNNKYPVEKITSWPNVKERLEILITLHQERWNSRGYPGAFFDERHRNFLMDISRVACEKGWLWLAQAHNGEEFGAVRMALKYNEVYYDWISGFDRSSSISKYRPGLGLLSLMIKEGIEEGASRVELLRGSERYKFDFTRNSRNNWRMTIPFYLQKNTFQSLVNRLLNYMAEGYSRLQREWTLLKVHYQENGFYKMFYSYGAFRAETILEKAEEMELFSESKK